jgi:hypothetical protein
MADVGVAPVVYLYHTLRTLGESALSPLSKVAAAVVPVLVKGIVVVGVPVIIVAEANASFAGAFGAAVVLANSSS